MKGTIQVKRLKDSAAYYTAKDYDKAYGGEYTFLLNRSKGMTMNSFTMSESLKMESLK